MSDVPQRTLNVTSRSSTPVKSIPVVTEPSVRSYSPAPAIFRLIATTGVLTKPDTLSTGASGQREKWRKVLLGQDEQAYLKHGYFCVRLPDDEARKRNTPISTLNKYFDATAPWNDLPKHVKARYGVDPLVSYVSKLLVDMFEKRLVRPHPANISLINTS